MMTLNGKTSHHDKPVPQHVQAIMADNKAKLIARIALQEAAKAEQLAFSPVNVPATKRQIRRRNYSK